MNSLKTALSMLAFVFSMLAGAQEQPKPPTGMVSLEQILETRAGNMGLVPAAAAADPDFIAFMTAIRSRDRLTGQLRPVAIAFESESQTTGLNSYELYQKMKTVLTSIQSSSQSLYGILFTVSQGRGSNTTQIMSHFHISVERGLRFGFGIGWQRRGRWFLPILTLRAGHLYNPNSGWTVMGVLADVGVETDRSGEVPEMVNLLEGDMTGMAVGIGWAGLTCSKNCEVKYNGIGVGVGYHGDSDFKGVQVRIPFFLPIPGMDPIKTAQKIEAKLVQALQRFNMTKAAELAAQYKIQVAKVVAFADKQGVRAQTYALENGHPLSSPGSLFSGSALVAYSPSLAPDLVQLYQPDGSRGKMRGRGVIPCQTSVVVTSEPASPKQLHQ